MSEDNPCKEAADEEKLLGDASYKASNFGEAIGHYQDAWELYADLGYKNNEATNRYQKEDYHGAIAASKNGIENAEDETKTSEKLARAYSRMAMCHVALGDMRKGVDFYEKSVAQHSTPAIVKKLEKLRKETDSDRALGDKVAQTVLESFKRLPKKRKPLEGGGKKEWVPLAGIMAQIGDKYGCIALGTGMKCLPFNKLNAAEGKVLHDWHAEVVALRSLNAFFLEEINKIRGEGKFLHLAQKSEYLRRLSWEERKNTVGRWHRDTPDYRYTIREGVRLHMYCSEAPCGDASMELTMAAQEDATPWEVATSSDGSALPGRGGFGQLGIVRRKPSRPDAPECRSKSCSDKLAQKQMTSVLNSLSALAISPQNAYLETFTIPESQYVHEAFQRCFGEKGRLKAIKDLPPVKGGYHFHAFKTLTTSQEFQYSRRSLAPDGSAPKPSNIACSWSPHHDETIIGGILQGCKLSNPVKDEAASATSRYKMWQALEADKRTADEQTKDVSFARSYKHIKEKKRMHARNSAKLAIRTVMMTGNPWVSNSGDESWTRESTQSLSKKSQQSLDHEPSSDDSDAVDDHSAAVTMARERYRPEIFFPRRSLRKNAQGEDEYEICFLGERGLKEKEPGLRNEHFDYEWMSQDQIQKSGLDPRGHAWAKYKREEADFYKHINSKAYKKHHARGEAMIETGEWIDHSPASSETDTDDEELNMDKDERYRPKILKSRWKNAGIQYLVQFSDPPKKKGGEIRYREEWWDADEMPQSGDVPMFHAHNPSQPRPSKPTKRGKFWTSSDISEGQYEEFLMMGKPGITLDTWMEMPNEEKDAIFLEEEMEMEAIEEAMKRRDNEAGKKILDLGKRKVDKKKMEKIDRLSSAQNEAREKERYGEEEEVLAMIKPPAPRSAAPSAQTSDSDSGDDLLANHDRKVKLLQNYPPTILKSRLDADGDLEYKVKYVSRIDEAKDEAHFEWEWMMADEMRRVSAYREPIRAFHEKNPGEVGGVKGSVGKAKQEVKKKEEETYPNGVPKVDLDTWMNMSESEVAAHRAAVLKAKAKLPAMSRDVARNRQKEKDTKKKIFNDKLAVAQAEFKRTMHSLSREERAERAESMVKECLRAAGLREEDIGGPRS